LVFARLTMSILPSQAKFRWLRRLIVAAGPLLAVLAPHPAIAQSGAAPPASDRPDPAVTGDTIPWLDSFDSARFTNHAASHYYYPTPTPPAPIQIFLPPVPPPLGTELPALKPVVNGVAAPAGLALFVSEIFYPMLAARMADDDLPKPLRQQLQLYRAAKEKLQNELWTKLDELKGATPTMREQQLAALAAAQDSRILAVETAADNLRTGLQETNLLGLVVKDPVGKENRDWRRWPGKDGSPADQQQTAAALRGAAYYEDGLSMAQRRILLECAIESGAAGNGSNAAEDGWIFFSPATARVRMPANLPDPLKKRVAEYHAKKDRLKSELCDALRSGEAGSADQTEALRRLAAAQTDRWTELDGIAEEIRRSLTAASTLSEPPAPTTLPPEITARIALYRSHKLEVLRTLQAMLARPAVPGQTRTADKIEGVRPAGNEPADPPVVRQATLQEAVAEFNRQQIALIGELNTEEAGIRVALADYARTTGQPRDRKSVNDLLKDFERARRQQELWAKYQDYRTAVLLPGLSPAQRRLLFDAAIEKLDLPLPPGRLAP
jgi:hypothetical protein